MKKILTYVAAFSAAVLMFSACEKSGGETSGGTQEAEGYVQIDDNEKVNLDKAKDGAKGIVNFDWVIGDGFDPIVKGQL